jgi:molybdopterin converting factor small subunit
MPRLTLPAPLFALLPLEERTGGPSRRSVGLEGRSWPAVARELRRRFPALAKRALTETDELVAGFVLVVNNEVLPRRVLPAKLEDEDEICLITTIAGG